MNKKHLFLIVVVLLSLTLVFGVTNSSYSLMLNPIPNEAPYQVTPNGTETVFFNPFAIKEIRFALNDLINRQYICDEVVTNSQVDFTFKELDHPMGFLYYDLALSLGLSEAGNEQKALNVIEAAMQAASDLEENKGKLLKVDGQWQFNGAAVIIQFTIRNDDSNRQRIGDYIASQLEKAGFSVEKDYKNMADAVGEVYYTDPEDFKWQMLTEGWTCVINPAYSTANLAMAYAPWYERMPGGFVEDSWDYENPELDRLTQALTKDYTFSQDEKVNLILSAVELGLKEAVRIHICAYTHQEN